MTTTSMAGCLTNRVEPPVHSTGSQAIIHSPEESPTQCPLLPLSLTIELGALDARSSWSEFESLAVAMSREVPLRALEATLDEARSILVCGHTNGAGTWPTSAVCVPAL
jgi:hypothetical protein